MPVAESVNLGDRLRALRKVRGITQQQLAGAAGLSISALARLEHGEDPNPRLATLQALAKALGVKVADLIGDE